MAAARVIKSFIHQHRSVVLFCLPRFVDRLRPLSGVRWLPALSRTTAQRLAGLASTDKSLTQFSSPWQPGPGPPGAEGNCFGGEEWMASTNFQLWPSLSGRQPPGTKEASVILSQLHHDKESWPESQSPAGTRWAGRQRTSSCDRL